MSRSLNKSFGLFVAVILVLFVLISFGVSYGCVHFIGSHYSERTASAALDFASLTINADNARQSFKTRIKSDDYESVQNKLAAYQRSNSDIINRISLVSFSNTAGVYIYDSGGEPLGSRLDYTSYTSSVKAELINGRNSMSHISNGRLTVYRPLRTVDDNLCGIVIVELQEPFETQYFKFIAAVFGGLLLLSLIFVLIFVLHLKKKISSPLRKISNYIDSIKKNEKEQKTADASVIFDDSRNDEIGQLSASLKTLLGSIDTGERDLNQAIYDANHDGMTQHWNKRFYHSMEDSFRKCDALCIIYFDVNNLKLMNDTLGHESGDFVIKRAANYIREFLEDGDYCFRMGGDEFLIVMTKSSIRRLDKVMDKLDKDSPYILSRKSDSVKCSLSYGCSYAKGVFSYDSLLAEAEENMYMKKAELKRLLNMPDR
ncbi:GGDEF domain-containing protein [Ruminococcus flavefaciens]|uniref:Diguanylate cyclase (GGDEF) domain-containing protein n=1 Tax=Ruminococcus flavefaciens TaxID=1265 RepID=A0A1K1PPN7_RUMFL|nr:GGDEF domain-containing protein [Ruminococcus flavefaciens]SFW49648.1 diguanylate cyclase (GGDEF) domain-containing protein [Ruminococcus flavefaciens]